MNIRTTLLATAAALFTICGTAQAATTETLNLGEVGIGSGTPLVITADHAGRYNAIITGELPAGDAITFTYTLTGFSNGLLSDRAGYNYHEGNTRYFGSSRSNSNGFDDSDGFTQVRHHHHRHTEASTPLVLTTANLPSNAGGTTTISNNSSGIADFVSKLSGRLLRGGEIIVNFSVSAVPLPASASLFVIGLALITGLGMRRKARAVAAQA